jgi:hypothetical protein
MKPELDDLIGTDIEPGERARLERVHELLVAAGPPPELPQTRPVELPQRRRRRGAQLAIAAALAVAAFALGAALVDSGRSVDFVVPMDATAAAPGASASLTVFELDDAGNWPMELAVAGLAPRTSDRPFQLWLTRKGEPEALCGAFVTGADGSAVVPMNAPYRFDEFDGWVVVEEGSETALLTT